MISYRRAISALARRECQSRPSCLAEEPGSTASDVLALIQRIEAAVKRDSGVELVREVVCLE